MVAELVEAVAFSITTFFFSTLIERVPASGNTVQPTLPCWVVPTAGSLCISSMAVCYFIIVFLVYIVVLVVSIVVLVSKCFVIGKTN